MIFILLTFLAAFSIEALGTLVSVLGLTSLFGMNAIIVSLAIALDLGKIVVVTLLYSYFKQLGIMMRSYAVIASIITMVITSAGAGSYLTAEFQKAMLGTQEGSLKVQVLKDQQLKYEERKKQIDLQIASLPEKTSVNQRLRLMSGFKTEQQELQNKITEIDKQLPALQINQIGVESKVGPILYIAKAFNIPVEEAVKWVILMIIVVFDPLAYFFLKEHIGFKGWIGVFIGFIGILFIAEFDGSSLEKTDYLGILSGVGAALAYTSIRELRKYYDSRAIVLSFCFSRIYFIIN